MTDAAHVTVAVLAVSLGYFLRTVVPYLNARTKDPGVPFEARYALGGVVLAAIGPETKGQAFA